MKVIKSRVSYWQPLTVLIGRMLNNTVPIMIALSGVMEVAFTHLVTVTMVTCVIQGQCKNRKGLDMVICLYRQYSVQSCGLVV